MSETSTNNSKLAVIRGSCSVYHVGPVLRAYTEANKSAEKLLQLLAYFDNQDLWFELLAKGWEDSHEWCATIISDKLCFLKF